MAPATLLKASCHGDGAAEADDFRVAKFAVDSLDSSLTVIVPPSDVVFYEAEAPPTTHWSYAATVCSCRLTTFRRPKRFGNPSAGCVVCNLPESRIGRHFRS